MDVKHSVKSESQGCLHHLTHHGTTRSAKALVAVDPSIRKHQAPPVANRLAQVPHLTRDTTARKIDGGAPDFVREACLACVA